MRKALHVFCRSITAILTVFMIAMLIVINSLVVTRYFFSYSPAWTEEVTRYCLVWMTMLGAGVLTLFGDHIALYSGVEMLPPRGRYWQRVFSHGVVFVSGVLITWTGFVFAFDMHDVVSTGLQITMLLPALAVPIGGFMIALFSGLLIVSSITEKMGGPNLEIPEQGDFMESSFKPADDDCAENPVCRHLNKESY